MSLPQVVAYVSTTPLECSASSARMDSTEIHSLARRTTVSRALVQARVNVPYARTIPSCVWTARRVTKAQDASDVTRASTETHKACLVPRRSVSYASAMTTLIATQSTIVTARMVNASSAFSTRLATIAKFVNQATTGTLSPRRRAIASVSSDSHSQLRRNFGLGSAKFWFTPPMHRGVSRF